MFGQKTSKRGMHVLDHLCGRATPMLWHSGKLKFDVYESPKMNYHIQCRSSDFQSLDFKIHND